MDLERTDVMPFGDVRPWQELLTQFAAPIPQHLSDVVSWQPHLPFAALLVRLLRPSVVVELGVHKGDSYCGFCEAAVNAQLVTSCFGIDTWRGDSQAGPYGDEVLRDLRIHHDPRYGTFSTLLQMTFDEALGHFDDGTIDLLHIDGLHTYEAARHDFDAWAPKVRDGGIVLLHDTAVREGDFGVWRLFLELSEEHPVRSFPFANGLGVVGIGEITRSDAGDLFRMDDTEWQAYSQALGVLGNRIQLIGAEDRAIALAREDGIEGDDAGAIALGYRDRVNQTTLLNQATTTQLEGTQRALDGLQRGYGDLQLKYERLRYSSEDVQAALHEDLASTHEALAEAREELTRAMDSSSWRVTAPLRWASGLRHRSPEPPEVPSNGAATSASRPDPATRHTSDGSATGYREWIDRFDDLTPDQLAVLTADSRRLASDGPLFSIVVPVYNPDLDLLREAVESVTSQVYPRWELCLVDDNSSDPGVRDALREIAGSDERILVIERPENGHISRATNSGIDRATGEWVTFLDQDDRLTRTALHVMAEEIASAPDVSFLYSDEDKLDADGVRSDPYFKPPPNRSLFLAQNVACHLSVYRRSVLLDVGGLRPEFDGAQDYDLALRVLDAVPASAVRRVPRVLYHWRVTPGSTASSIDAKPYARDASRRAVDEHLRRNGIAATVTDSPSGSFNEVQPPPDMFTEDAPLVSILIPTRDHLPDLTRCIGSLTSRTTYPNIELIVVDNGSTDPDTLAYLDALSRDGTAVVLRDDGPFNYSRLNNQAASHATGEFLLLLNNDTEVDAPDWIESMLFWFQWDDVGTVGAKLLYPDGHVQHGGIILGIGGVAGHAQKYASALEPGYFGRLEVAVDVDGNTGACMLVRKSLFDRLQGLDEQNLAVAFNDVDFCLRVSDLGLRNVWTPNARLIHYESRSRGDDGANPVKARRAQRESDYMHWRWGKRLTEDRNYNPNLTATSEDFGLAFPPRTTPLALNRPVPSTDHASSGQPG